MILKSKFDTLQTLNTVKTFSPYSAYLEIKLNKTF